MLGQVSVEMYEHSMGMGTPLLFLPWVEGLETLMFDMKGSELSTKLKSNDTVKLPYLLP